MNNIDSFEYKNIDIENINNLDLLTVSSDDSDDVSEVSKLSELVDLLNFTESDNLISQIDLNDLNDLSNLNINHNKINKYYDDPDLDYMVDVFANEKKIINNQSTHLTRPTHPIIKINLTKNLKNDDDNTLLFESDNKTNNINKLHQDFFIYVSKHHNDLFHQVLSAIVQNE